MSVTRRHPAPGSPAPGEWLEPDPRTPHARRPASNGAGAGARGGGGTSCCDQADAAGLDGTDFGGVICCNNVKNPCPFNTNIDAFAANPLARNFIKAAVRLHEKTHLDDVDCTGAALERPGFRADRDPRTEECEGNRVELASLRINRPACGKDPACGTDMDALIADRRRRATACAGP